MLKKVSITIFVILYYLIAYAQKTSITNSKLGTHSKSEIVSNYQRTYLSKDSNLIFSDPILKSIVPHSIPNNWLFYVKDNEFIIECKDSSHVLLENKINAPISNDSKEKREARIKTYGLKTKSFLSYTFEPRWDVERLQQSIIFNSQIYNQINNLEKKHGITYLIDNLNSGRQGKVYNPKNEKDKALLTKYYQEEKELKAQLIKLPNYHTSNYSLFLNKKFGCNDDQTSIYPETISIDLYHIEMLFNEICAK